VWSGKKYKRCCIDATTARRALAAFAEHAARIADVRELAHGRDARRRSVAL
jgi:hypothetical protein